MKVIGVQVVIICLLLALGQTGAQEKPARQPKPVEQSVKVVPDVAPADLEAEIRKLNALGYAVDKQNLILVGERFTIVVTDSDFPWDGGEDEQEQ